jgi:hypothetical protein
MTLIFFGLLNSGYSREIPSNATVGLGFESFVFGPTINLTGGDLLLLLDIWMLLFFQAQ